VLRVIVQVAKRSLKHEPLPPEPDELFSNAGNLIACFISFCRKEPGISSLVLRVLRLVEVVSIFVLIAGLVLAPPDSSVASDEYNYADEEAAAARCVNGGGAVRRPAPRIPKMMVVRRKLPENSVTRR
jgi:hypothetical protein